MPEYQFIFDERPANAKKNYALDTYYLLRRCKIDSIRLVTSAEEIPRAMYELVRYLPKTIHVVSHPVSLKEKIITPYLCTS